MTGMVMTVVEKFQRSILLLKFMIRLSAMKRDNIRTLQANSGFPGGRVARVHFIDMGRHFDLKVVDGCIEHAGKGETPTTFVNIKEFCTLKHLRLGHKAGRHPVTGDVVRIHYTLLTAWSSGDISNYGEASTNDMLAFMDMFMEVVELIPPDDIIKLVGPCEHDIGTGR